MIIALVRNCKLVHRVRRMSLSARKNNCQRLPMLAVVVSGSVSFLFCFVFVFVFVILVLLFALLIIMVFCVLLMFLLYFFWFVFVLSSVCVLCPKLPVSLDCPFFIDPSVFSNLSKKTKRPWLLICTFWLHLNYARKFDI